MNTKTSLVLMVIFFLPFMAIEASEQKFLELPGIQIIPIQDTEADRQYELYIKLPEGYSKDKGIKYPVIYIADAMWHIEILSGSVEHLVKDAILVGISWQKDLDDERAYVSRFRDYTLTKSGNPNRARGQARNHLTFIRNDVIKYVENNYQTDPDNRTYFGYSLSGMFGAYVLLTQPDTFKNYILGSPTTLADDSYIYDLESIAAQKTKNLNANVFVSIGELEKAYMVGQAVGLVSLLKSERYINLSSKLVVIESADHGQAFPMSAIRGMYWLSVLMSD